MGVACSPGRAALWRCRRHGVGFACNFGKHADGTAKRCPDPEAPARRGCLAQAGTRLRSRRRAIGRVKVVGCVHGSEDSSVELPACRAPGFGGVGPREMRCWRAASVWCRTLPADLAWYQIQFSEKTTDQMAQRLLRDGSFARHLRQRRGLLLQQQHRVLRSIARHFPAGTKVTRPEGGDCAWVELPAASMRRSCIAWPTLFRRQGLYAAHARQLQSSRRQGCRVGSANGRGPRKSAG